jgi:hypothetical protein
MLRLFAGVRNIIWDKIIQWLTREKEIQQVSLSDFERLRYELRPGDVLLVEGRSRVSDIIKVITQSCWTHSFLYVGRLHDIDDPDLRKQIEKFYPDNADDQLIIESLLGKGTIVDTLDNYNGEHLRICRPRGLTRHDAQEVIGYAINQLGSDYNVRQLLDLARFMFPYGILPRRWRSSLFEHNAGKPTQTVCSTMMAEAFARVHFPIRPVLHRDKSGKLRLYQRNTRLITPADFDYSPFFDVIKYPLMDFDELSVYRKLPWDKTGVHWNETGDDLVADVAMNQHDENISINIEQKNPDAAMTDKIETTEQEQKSIKGQR